MSRAQETPPSSEKPQVRYSYLNVCTPSDSEKQEIAAALARVPSKPKYSDDFEVTRGHTSLQNAPSARYVRLRRELASDAVFSNVQYSISTDAENTTETLVFKVKDPKDLLLLSIEDSISSSAAAPGAILAVDTPASRIKIERFGKSSIVLARCDTAESKADQTAYEPLFTNATKLLSGYRRNLGLHGMFRSDLAWVSAAPHTKTKPIESRASVPQSADKETPKDPQ
jgi:hypothetical protein